MLTTQQQQSRIFVHTHAQKSVWSDYIWGDHREWETNKQMENEKENTLIFFSCETFFVISGSKWFDCITMKLEWIASINVMCEWKTKCIVIEPYENRTKEKETKKWKAINPYGNCTHLVGAPLCVFDDVWMTASNLYFISNERQHVRSSDCKIFLFILRKMLCGTLAQ